MQTKEEIRMSNIGLRIIVLRQSVNLGQEGLASFLGMSRSNLSHIENSNAFPTLRTISSLCLIFNVYSDWLVLGIGDEPREDFIQECYFRVLEKNQNFRPIIPDEITESIHTIFARNLKIYRKEIKLTQQNVAQQLGIGRTTYNDIELGKTNITSDTLRLLSITLNVSTDLLLFNIDQSKKGYVYPQNILFESSNKSKRSRNGESDLYLDISKLTPKQKKIIKDLLSYFENVNNVILE
jgi:transcriptional regulator with XRE-family HTH domain